MNEKKSRWDHEDLVSDSDEEHKKPKKQKIIYDKNAESKCNERLDLITDEKKMKKRLHTIMECRKFEETYEKLNKIEEGTYGVVFRAKNKITGEIVALKHLKLENENNGFPITSLREIYTLLFAKHNNIVNVKEIVTGKALNSIYIVMEYIEHDLKSLMTDMPSPFLQSEVKTLMLQLLSAVEFLHKNWIVHRDLKTSNLLVSNLGQIKVADFGLARKYSSPLGSMTQLVVTLWYRAPELLFGENKYSTKVDMWSIGCIFAELLHSEPLFPGRGELDQIKRIFSLLGTPDEKKWPGFKDLPNAKLFKFSVLSKNRIREKFTNLTHNGIDLLSKLLEYDPDKRISANEAISHPYFSESPLPKDPRLFPTWPSKSSCEKRKSIASPSLPKDTKDNFLSDNTSVDTDSLNYNRMLFDMDTKASDTSMFRLRL